MKRILFIVAIIFIVIASSCKTSPYESSTRLSLDDELILRSVDSTELRHAIVLDDRIIIVGTQKTVTVKLTDGTIGNSIKNTRPFVIKMWHMGATTMLWIVCVTFFFFIVIIIAINEF